MFVTRVSDVCSSDLPVPSAPFPQIFTHERKWYSRKDLARHRMQGDPDDTSHRGHPLCKFCDERYLDNDELLKHLRRDHYFCHFCDADGAQDYYRWVRWGPECHRWVLFSGSQYPHDPAAPPMH